MSKFNYTNLHFFDKHGVELPIAYNSSCIAEIINEYGDNAVFYGMKDCSTGEIEYIKKTSGNRFTQENGTEKCHLTVGNTTYETLAEVSTAPIASNANKQEYCIADINSITTSDSQINIDEKIAALPFPTVTMTSGLTISPVSVDLVETQSLYILCEDGEGNFRKLSDILDDESLTEFKEHYKLLFYVNTKKQQDFRFFKVNNSTLTWSDRIIVNFKERDFKVNIGFSAKEEGLYQEPLYICLLKDFDESDSTSGEIYPIGAIDLQAEAIGEDERYRTLFANFGVPDPIHYQEVFANTTLEEEKTDYVKLNENSKKLFLTYDEIFSYVGTYKALINAINVLGWHDVFFKEWYKEIGKVIPNQGYVAYDMYYKADANANTINNVPLEERISLKKLNWLSMIYRINKELVEEAEDQWGFPSTLDVYDYNDEEIIIKLYSLKRWLEKYIIGLNCKIIDVSGEGIYFERYKLDSFGTYQEIYDWNNSKNLIPTVVTVDDELGEPETYYLHDSSTQIKVDVGLYTAGTFEDYKNYTLKEFCDGYFDDNDIYHHNLETAPEDGSSCIFTGKTFACLNDFEEYELKATSYGENFLFGQDYLSEDSAWLRIQENKIFFNPYDLLEKEQTSIFTLLPFIQLEKANIRKKNANWNNAIKYRINPKTEEDTYESYIIKDLETGKSVMTPDYITLVPPTYEQETLDSSIVITSFSGTEVELNPTYIPSFEHEPGCEESLVAMTQNIKTYGLRYSALNRMHMPLFSIIGYEIDGNPDFMDVENEYYLEILDGKMLFDDVANDRKIFLNFNYDENTGEQEVKICIIYTSDNFRIESYQDDTEVSAFIPGNQYSTFVENYNEDPETAISYYNIHEITVKNTGKFTVDVYAKDSQNNIFAKNCENFAYVYLPDFSISTYTNSSGSAKTFGKSAEAADDYDISLLFYNYQDFCIYNNSYLIDRFKKFVDDENQSLSISYPTYSYSMHKANAGDYLHFMNIADRYMIDAIEYKTNSTLDKTYSGYFLTLEKNGLNYYSRVIEETDSAALLAYSNNYANSGEHASSYMDNLYRENQELDYMDVNFILYNELAHYPILQTYAIMLNANAIPYRDEEDKYTDGKYRLLIGEYSDMSYIWASLTEHIKQDIPKIINNYIDSEENIEVGPHGDENPEPEPTDWDNVKIPLLPSFVLTSFEKNHKLGYKVDVTDEDVPVEDDEEEEEEEEEKNVLENYYVFNSGENMYNDIVENLVGYIKDSSITLNNSDDIDENIYDIETKLSDIKESLENIINTYDASALDEMTTEEIVTWINEQSFDYVFDGHSSDLFIDVRAETCLGCSEAADVLFNEYLVYMIYQPDRYQEFINASPEEGIEYILGREESGVYKGLYADAQGQELYDDLYDSDNVSLSTVMKSAAIDSSIIYGIAQAITEAAKLPGNDIEEMYHKYIETFYKNFTAITGTSSYPIIEQENYDGITSSVYKELITTNATVVEVRNTAQIIMRKALLETEIESEAISTISDDFIKQYNKFLFAVCAFIGISTLYNLTQYDKYVTYRNIGLNNFYSEFLGNRNDVTISSYANTVKVANALYKSFFADYGELDINSAMVEKYDDEFAKDEYLLYDKIVVTLMKLTSEFLTDKWVTKEYRRTDEGHEDELDILYAVAAPIPETAQSDDEDNAYKDKYTPVEENSENYNLYYVKPKGNSFEGLSYTYSVDTEKGEGIPIDRNKVKNALPYIEELVNKPYISAYVQPTWQSQVSISLITPDSAVRLGFIDNVDDYNKVENQYLCIQFSYSDFTWHFRKGEMIKLVFKSLANDEYIGQSSYEVVGYDTEEQVVIVKGAINAAYVRKEKHEVWAELDLSKISEEEQDILNSYTASDVEERNVEPFIRTYHYQIGEDEAETVYRLPVKKISGKWYYKVFYFVNGVPRAIETVKIDPQEKVNMYISYAHNIFVDYIMNAKTATENSNGTTDLDIDYNLLNCRKMQFIDDTFVMYANEFDINEGLAAWMNSSILDGSVYGAILDNDVYKYTSENGFVPVEISQNSPNVAFTINFEDMGLDFNESYVQWKVYRKLNTDNDRIFMFESYNKILYLDYTELGIYDIEANIYDKYGNTLTKMFKGAYKVVEAPIAPEPVVPTPDDEENPPVPEEPQPTGNTTFTGKTFRAIYDEL